MGCDYAHQCSGCNRRIRQEKRAEERDAEKAERKREKHRRRKSASKWWLYCFVAVCLVFVAYGVAESNQQSQSTQEVVK